MNNSFYSEDEIKKIGFKEIGSNILISRKASIYSPEKMILGNNIRIDDFCILSGNIIMGDNIHIAAYSALYGGKAGITIDDFANVSSRVCVYALSDDYSGSSLTNPTVPEKYKLIQSNPVFIGKHVIIGSGCTILPGASLNEGTAIGAMSMCKDVTEPWKIYVGIPARCIKNRKKDVLKLEKEYLNND